MAKRKRKYYETILEMIEAERRGVPIEESFRKLSKKTASKTKPSKLSIAEKEYKDAIRSGASDITVQSKLNALNAIKSGRDKKDDGRRWFQKGAFEDGYQIGDISKTIIGTGKDFLDDAATGAIKLGEGIFDMGTYLVGGAADLFGADDFAEDVKKFAARDLTNELDLGAGVVKTLPIGDIFTKANDFINKGDDEKASLLGDKMDSLVQSAGQLAGTAGLQMVGVPWWLTTGASSFGTAAEEAFQNDATYGEAGGYGLIKGGADVLTEKLFGGIKFKGKAIDDAFKQTLAQGISDKTVKTLTKLGLDMTGEGIEEALAEVIGNVGKKLSYEDEKTWGELLTSEEAMDNYLEAFIGGAALGGGFNVKKAYNSIKTGRDYDTGLSDNERKVVDSEIKNRTDRIQKERSIKQQVDQIIAEREKTFGELNNSQKENIKAVVMSKLESGEIDYTASKLDKKEIAKIESEVTEDLKSGYIGIDTIEDVLAGDKTAVLRDLKERLTNTTDNAQKAELESEINRITGEKAARLKGLLKKDVILQESYVQEALKGKEFSREATKADSYITKELIESAKAAKMNDTRAMHTLFDYTSKIANETNTKYGFTNNEQLTELGYSTKGKTINGLVRKNEDGTTKVLINVDSDKALNSIIGHETTHLLEETNEYEALQEMVKEYAKTKGEYDSRYKELSELYKGVDADLENEITSDLVGDYLFTDEQFINSLSTKEPNVFKRIYDYVKHAFKMATAGSKEARQLEQVKQRFEKAYRAIEKSTRKAEAASNLNTEGDSKTKYSNDSNVEPEKLYAGRELSKDKEIYNYDFLTSLPAIKKVQLPKIKEITDDGKVSREKVLELGRSNAEKVGKVDGEHYKIKNRYTGRDITVTNTTIKHGLNGDNKRLLTNGRVGAIAGEVIQNAVPVNALYDTAPQAAGTYIMAGIATEEGTNKRFIYVITVEQYNDNVSGIETYDVGHSISGRIEKSSLADTKSPGLIPTEAANISIKDFLEIVNNTHKSVLSDDVLSRLEETRPKNGYYTDKVKFSLSAPVEETKELDENSDITYNKLISKPDMNIIPLSEEQVRNLNRKEIVDKARENAKSVGGVDTLGRIAVHVDDVNSDVIVGANAIRHGFVRNFETNAKIALHIGEYLKNSIKVNEIEARSDNAVGGYVLLGYGKDVEGNHYPAYFVVETLTTGESELIEFDSLHSFNGKKIVEAIGEANQDFKVLTSTKISISALLDIVNETYSDILPETVAEHYGNERRKTKLGESVKFSLSAPVEETKKQVKENKQSSPAATFEKAYRAIEKSTGKAEAASNLNTEGDSNTKYALGRTKDNKVVAIIENDILKNVPKEDWIKTVKKEIKKFRPGIPISGRFIKVTKKSGGHFLNSAYTDKLRNNEAEMYADKLKTSKNIKDVIYASTDYVNEEIKHDRKDDIKEFARGKVYLRISENDYEASVLIGYTDKNEMLFYDIQDLEPTSFELKEKRYSKDRSETSETSKTTVSLENSISDLTKDVKTYDYDMQKNIEYTKDDIKFSFSLRNKNITEDTPIPYVVSDKYIHVNKNNKIALSYLQDEVKKLPRGTYENKATGYKADINGKTIWKILKPKPNFNPWGKNYIDNLNAALSLPQLFGNAVYLDTIENQKRKNANKEIKGFHHFIAPLHMNGEDYRVRIVAREKENSNILYIVDTEILQNKEEAAVPNNMNGNFMTTSSEISIPDLIKDVKIYDYDMQKNIEYTKDDIKFSFSLRNKNITEDTPIPYVVSDKYIHVNKNNKIALSYLQDEVKKLPRGTYENKATGYKADINSRTIKKIINPTQRFNPWSSRHNYIENLNAAMKLPELFENAVYIDTSENQKKSNGEQFHYFVAPIYMNNKTQRALITARSGDKYDILYVVKVDIIENKKGDQAAEQMLSTSIGAPFDITIPDLIRDVKIYDYDMQKNIEYTKDDIKFSFSLRNKNITEDTPIPYVVSDKYIHVNKNNKIALSYLQDEVKKLPRGTYENKATGYKADINSNTINKALKPTHKGFNEYGENYIKNLNAILNLPELFKNALYVDTIKNQKDKNLNKKIKGFHHFIAPLKMNGEDYRALITAREKENSDSIYVLRVEVMPMKKKMPQVATSSIGSQFTETSSTVTIPDLIRDVKIYDYDMQKNIEYTKDDIKFSLSELIKNGNDDVTYNALSEEDLAAYEQERDEAFRRIPDDYMPDEDSEYYNPPDVTPLDDGYLKLVSKNIRKVLNLKSNQIPALKRIIQDYSTSEEQTPESLYKLIKDEFGKVTERNKLQDISEVKAFIRQTGIRVSDYIKSEIPDYASWKQKQFGKMKIAVDGLEVDDVYEGLKDVYPQFFPEDIINPAEQLMRISEVVGMSDTAIEKYSISEEDIQFAADFIYDSVYDYKQQKRLEYAMQDDIAPVDESRIPHNLFDNGDIAPVKSSFDSNDFSKSVGVQQKYDAKTETITESERDVETERLERKKKQAIEDLGSLEEYTSRKADELYQEVRTMRKGKRVSEDLGYILDHLFVGMDKESAEYDRKKDRIYKNITDALIRMSKNPNKPERASGYVESIIREAIESRYRWDIAAINSWELDPVAKTRRELRRNLINKDPEFMKKALSSAKNRKRIFMNNTDTIRTTELVFGRENGKIINDMIFQKAIDNEADSIAWQNKERKEIAALGIKAKDKFGRVTKESAAVQKYGEGKYLDDSGEYIIYDDEALEKEFENPDDRARIINAARVIRQKYDEYIDKANEVLTSLKFDPIPKRDDYMRHFQVLNDKFSQFGIPFNPQSMQEHVLPTDINGLTEFWSPQKNYFANLRPREGMRTTLDAITGIDGYISGIANLIYHTEDIQRGRAFEELIRENFGEDKGWKNLKELPEEEQAERIEQIQGSHLSEYAAWLHEWTNNLAGKKNKLDRIVEEILGRKVFSILDGMRKGTSTTMLGFNLSSALTNLIAPVQAMAKTNKAAVLRGTADTIKNIFIKDSFMEDNRFLTARMGTEMLSKRPWDKIRDTGFIFMKGMDWFASNQIVRSKYYELKSKGLSDEDAHAGAGQFAARIMGDRTKGAMPQLYNSKVFNILAQFQLEVNNQLYSMFYDTYHESRESAKERAGSTATGMVFTLGQLFIFTHIFGQTFKAITGYNPTFDVIAILATALGIGDDDDDKTPTERLQKAAGMLVDALPYSSLLSDGGRIPVTNMLPDIMGIFMGSEDEYGRKKTIASEGEKILPYLLPTGGNQIKKTIGGLKMFSDDLPVTGSYTDKGDLRFPVKENPANVVQAAIFGQWANKNAREYFDKEVGTMDGDEIEEYRDLNVPISDYWKYREELKSKDSAAEKIEYINSLDLSVRKKNIMVNNRIKRENPFDLENYDNFESYEEFKFATDHPEEYLIARASGGYKKYERMKFAFDAIKADKDDYGRSISGSRKEKIISFLNSSSTMSYEEKLILFKKQYPADDTYNYEIIDYLNSRDDINYREMRTILTELGFTVDLQGNISW